MILAKVDLTLQNPNARQFIGETGSGHHIVLDDAIGKSGPKPIELVAVALAGCTAFDVITYLRGKKRAQVAGYEVRVEAEQRETPPQVFTDIRVHHVVTGDHIDEQWVMDAIHLSETKFCSVGGMLRMSGAEMTTTWEIVPATKPAIHVVEREPAIVA
jgi:putative redox protein